MKIVSTSAREASVTEVKLQPKISYKAETDFFGHCSGRGRKIGFHRTRGAAAWEVSLLPGHVEVTRVKRAKHQLAMIPGS